MPAWCNLSRRGERQPQAFFSVLARLSELSHCGQSVLQSGLQASSSSCHGAKFELNYIQLALSLQPSIEYRRPERRQQQQEAKQQCTTVTRSLTRPLKAHTPWHGYSPVQTTYTKTQRRMHAVLNTITSFQHWSTSCIHQRIYTSYFLSLLDVGHDLV